MICTLSKEGHLLLNVALVQSNPITSIRIQRDDGLVVVGLDEASNGDPKQIGVCLIIKFKPKLGGLLASCKHPDSCVSKNESNT